MPQPPDYSKFEGGLAAAGEYRWRQYWGSPDLLPPPPSQGIMAPDEGVVQGGVDEPHPGDGLLSLQEHFCPGPQAKLG